MKILVDTHIAMWSVFDTDKLSKDAPKMPKEARKIHCFPVIMKNVSYMFEGKFYKIGFLKRRRKTISGKRGTFHKLECSFFIAQK